MVATMRRALLVLLAGVLLGTAGLASGTPRGGPTQVAYRATVVNATPKTPPQNRAVGYRGQPLVMVAHQVPSLAREPVLAVNKTGDVFFAAKAGSAPAGGADHRIFLLAPGATKWSDVSGSLVQRRLFFTAADPDVEVDADTGRMFWAGIAIPRPAAFAYSDDKGATWTTTEAYSAGANDHETVVTGNVPPESGVTTTDPRFPKIVYYCANSLYLVSCARSLDGGRTFLQTQGSPLAQQGRDQCGGETGFMTSDTRGRIFIGGANCGVPQVAVSDDAGTTFTDVTVSATIRADHHDVEVSTDSSGNVYALWTDVMHLPYLAVSRDHGHSWGRPMMVAAPGVRSIGFAALTAGDTGRIAVTYVGTTSGDAKDLHRPWRHYVAVSTDALAPEPTFVSTVSPTPAGTSIVNRGDCCPGMYDYLDVDSAPSGSGALWASLSDVCSVACERSATGVDDVYPGQGFALEQVSGPALRGKDRWV